MFEPLRIFTFASFPVGMNGRVFGIEASASSFSHLKEKS
jgi:hypothetical protein